MAIYGARIQTRAGHVQGKYTSLQLQNAAFMVTEDKEQEIALKIRMPLEGA